MATKDYSLKKGGDKRESSFNLNNGAKNDLSTLVVKSQSEMTKKSNSFGGNEYPQTKKDSHSWRNSSTSTTRGMGMGMGMGTGSFGFLPSSTTSEFGESGKFDQSLFKLKTDDTNSFDSSIEKPRGNPSPASSIFGSNTTLTNVRSAVPVGLWNLDPRDYNVHRLICELKPHDHELYYDPSLPSKTKELIFFNFPNLPIVEYFSIKTTLNETIRILASVNNNGNEDMEHMFKAGDILMILEVGKDKKIVDLAFEMDPVHTFLHGNNRLEIWRPSHNEILEMLIEHCKLSSLESKSSGELKSTPALPSASQTSTIRAPIPLQQNMKKHENIPDAQPQMGLQQTIPEEAAASVPKRGKIARMKDGILRAASNLKSAVSCKGPPKAIAPPSQPPMNGDA